MITGRAVSALPLHHYRLSSCDAPSTTTLPGPWAAHNVLFHRTGFKQLHHPVVGDLDLTYEALELPSDPGLTLLVYTAEPGTPTQDALNLLASWAATLEQEQRAESQNANDAS